GLRPGGGEAAGDEEFVEALAVGRHFIRRCGREWILTQGRQGARRRKERAVGKSLRPSRLRVFALKIRFSRFGDRRPCAQSASMALRKARARAMCPVWLQ